MKVSELPYRRVTLEEVSAAMDDIIARIKNASSADEILAAREDYLKIYLEYSTNYSLAYMRYTINTADEFYVAENDYYDEVGPKIQNYMVAYACALLEKGEFSARRAALESGFSGYQQMRRAVRRKQP